MASHPNSELFFNLLIMHLKSTSVCVSRDLLKVLGRILKQRVSLSQKFPLILTITWKTHVSPIKRLNKAFTIFVPSLMCIKKASVVCSVCYSYMSSMTTWKEKNFSMISSVSCRKEVRPVPTSLRPWKTLFPVSHTKEWSITFNYFSICDLDLKTWCLFQLLPRKNTTKLYFGPKCRLIF